MIKGKMITEEHEEEFQLDIEDCDTWMIIHLCLVHHFELDVSTFKGNMKLVCVEFRHPIFTNREFCTEFALESMYYKYKFEEIFNSADKPKNVVGVRIFFPF